MIRKPFDDSPCPIDNCGARLPPAGGVFLCGFHYVMLSGAQRLQYQIARRGPPEDLARLKKTLILVVKRQLVVQGEER